MEFYEYIIICSYAHITIMWALFAALMSTKVHPTAPARKHIYCFCINFIVAPLAITIAVLMLAGGKHDKYFMKP